MASKRATAVLGAWSAGLAAAVLAPLVAPGYVLSYDMVAVPDQALVPAAFGMSSALPRAVPLDAVVAIADSIVGGAVLQRLALAAVIGGAALGAGLVLRRADVRVRMVAASVYAWNAYVCERLVIGHWPLLVAYAALPWLVVAAARVRSGPPSARCGRSGLAGGIVAVGVASLTPTGGVLAATLFGALLVAPGGRHGRLARAVGIGAAVLLQAPWVVPAILRPNPAVSDPAGVAAFATRSDSPAGLVGSVLSLGGIWNGAAVPDSRAAVSALLLTFVVLVLALAGVRQLRRYVDVELVWVLGGMAAIGMAAAVFGAVGVAAPALEWAVAELPGAGLLRDGQKFLAWYALPLALAAAAGTGRLVAALERRPGTLGPVRAPWVAVVAALLPMAALPDLAWGAGGRLQPVDYPAAWAQVREQLAEAQDDGAAVVLPFQPYRRFPWAENRTVLDPAPRYLGVDTVVPDALPVGGVLVRGEDERARRVSVALDGERPMPDLAALGVRWIVVERDTPGDVRPAVLADAEPVRITGVLDLYRVPGPVATWSATPPWGPVIAADILSLVTLVVASADLFRTAGSGRRRSLASRLP